MKKLILLSKLIQKKPWLWASNTWRNVFICTTCNVSLQKSIDYGKDMV